MHIVFKSFSVSCWRHYILLPWKKNRQVVSQMYQVGPCFAGENRKHWAMTLYYQRNISWPALDGLMIDCCSFIFRNGQMPTMMTASVSGKERDVHCLSASWPWLLGPKLFQMGQRLTDMVRVVSRGLIGKLKAPVSVLCKVQSCVTYWHTHVCLEYHWVLCHVLKKTNLLSAKKLSPCLVLCSQPELDEYSRGENTSGMQHQQRCLVSCIYWFFVIVACFFI